MSHSSFVKRNHFLSKKSIQILLTFILLFHLLFTVSPMAESQNVIDADVVSATRNNARFIKRHHIITHQKKINVGNKIFVINIFTKKGPNKQKYFVVHDSEDAAFDAGLRAIKHGGTLIVLENNEYRNLYSFGNPRTLTKQDPNRMFYKENLYWPVAKELIELSGNSPNRLIIVLHNNKPDGNFDLNHIKTWKNITIESEKDPDIRSLIWIPGLTIKPNKKVAKEINFYKKSGFNVVYEYVPKGERGDGSFSVYAAKHGVAYRNIEVEAGIRGNKKSELHSRKKQIKYLNTLRKYHKIK